PFAWWLRITAPKVTSSQDFDRAGKQNYSYFLIMIKKIADCLRNVTKNIRYSHFLLTNLAA
ncbi:hypothetical protein KC221_28005, partial [Mycobacterium tuberculosis]|nr:hypothetical protein [Mycobacterium tuberculosis]